MVGWLHCCGPVVRQSMIPKKDREGPRTRYRSQENIRQDALLPVRPHSESFPVPPKNAKRF